MVSGKWCSLLFSTHYSLLTIPHSRYRPDVRGTFMPANVDKQSLRGFLRMVEQDFPDEMVRIREPIGLGQERTALVFKLERAGRQPVVIFENVAGGRMPLVTNVAA